MRLLSVSDEVIGHLQTAQVHHRVGAIDAIVGCGDLPFSYLEHLVSVLNVPCFYVNGNHDAPEECADGSIRDTPQGCESLDLRVTSFAGMLIAGVSGVLRYREGDYQYSEKQWRRRLLALSLRTMLAQQRHRRPLDVLICHSPPAGLHDGPRAHRGPQALRRFVDRFGPRYVLHGHVHINYGYGDQRPLQHGRSTIINTCGYRLLEIETAVAMHQASVS
ncbi:MAG TPA: metallophosphoesterase [Herpetosiphonaceae bacterium]|nr:metallophosphoesterase [Herpetosiphonaceae bacterium]